MKFSDLQFERHTNYPDTGIAARHFFENGYGVSVVRFPGSYGSEEGLYEVAILQGVAENWNICYDTVLTDDVLGYQSEEEVEVLLYFVSIFLCFEVKNL
jgi:hypothetical protein